ncbi:MAG TPA: DegV family protein [Actinomycetota bacterium]|nr:DegV family protein [Actinomycetota bacterium]
MPVRIVTDSAADLPSELAAARGIEVVPLTIRFGDTTYRSGVDLSAGEFWDKLRSSTESPATAAPSPGDFESVYRKLAEDGADGIVSVHLSAKLSATSQSATIAARSTDLPVEVVDSLSVSASTALMALRAADLADGGATMAEIANELKSMVDRTQLYGVIDTLDYLRRGGRIGGAQALLGTMLQVKPVISVVDGVVEPVGKVRTRTRALQHLATIVNDNASSIERLIVMDGEAPDLDQFLGMLRGIEVPREDIWSLGPVVGTHAGPGVVGAVFTTSA